MFDQIAPRYDLLNHVLSGGTDIAWRRLAVKEALRPSMRRVLDLACGTGDMAMEIRQHAHAGCEVIGADFSAPMLRKAQVKAPDGSIAWIEADGLRLPFASESFDLVTIAFGIRNMESLEGGLREMRRVLRPGGTIAILEFSKPENAIVRGLYMPYFLHVLPRIGALLSQKSAYLYLPFSVVHFPGRKELARTMQRCGIGQVRHCALSLGIAALHLGVRE